MPSELSHLNRERALDDPEAHFKTPNDLALEIGLTRGEKIAALARWARLVDRRLASGDEGMPTSGTEPRDAELMQQIALVKAKLENVS